MLSTHFWIMIKTHEIELCRWNEVRLNVKVHVGIRRAQEHARNGEAVVTVVGVS